MTGQIAFPLALNQGALHSNKQPTLQMKTIVPNSNSRILFVRNVKVLQPHSSVVCESIWPHLWVQLLFDTFSGLSAETSDMKALSRVLTVPRPRDLYSHPFASFLCSGITSLIFPPMLLPCWQHTTPPVFLCSSSHEPHFNNVSNQCLEFNLDKAVELYFTPFPSCMLLCGNIIFHLWLFGCYIMQRVLWENRFWLFI